MGSILQQHHKNQVPFSAVGEAEGSTAPQDTALVGKTSRKRTLTIGYLLLSVVTTLCIMSTTPTHAAELAMRF